MRKYRFSEVDMIKAKHYFIILVFLSFFSLSTTNIYAENIDSIKSIKSITVVMDDNYPPFSFRDSKGDLQGIIIDHMSELTHI
jgi:ABC-type amino acid transport substrate-binding protein